MFSGWFKRKNGVKLHGYNLSKWIYLGYAIPKFHKPNRPDEITDKTFVYFFIKRSDMSTRSYHVADKYFTGHPFIDHHLPLWKSGQLHYADLIRNPSQELIDILDEQGYKHMGDGLWSKTHKEKIVEEKENVVTVNFGVDKNK